MVDSSLGAVRAGDGVTLKKIILDPQNSRVILQPFNLDFDVQILDADQGDDAFLIGVLSLQLRLFDLRHWRGKTAKSKTSPKSAQFEVIGDPNTSRNVQTTTWTSLKAVLYISPPHKDLSLFVQVIQAWSFGWLFI